MVGSFRWSFPVEFLNSTSASFVGRPGAREIPRVGVGKSLMSIGTIRVQVRMATHYLLRSQQKEKVMSSLDGFVHHENLILFKKQLANPWIDKTQRQQLLRLLAEEKAKDFLHEDHRSHRPTGDRCDQPIF
jgi:hypothetical protein